MRIAVIKWPKPYEGEAMHLIAGNNAETDQQLSAMAFRWAACCLSDKAYEGCEIYLITAETHEFTRIGVKYPE